jgi:hypothetical protein
MALGLEILGAGIGLAIFGGLASIPAGIDGALYVAVVVAGGLSAIGFGVVGLAEKHGVV